MSRDRLVAAIREVSQQGINNERLDAMRQAVGTRVDDDEMPELDTLERRVSTGKILGTTGDLKKLTAFTQKARSSYQSDLQKIPFYWYMSTPVTTPISKFVTNSASLTTGEWVALVPATVASAVGGALLAAPSILMWLLRKLWRTFDGID